MQRSASFVFASLAIASLGCDAGPGTLSRRDGGSTSTYDGGGSTTTDGGGSTTTDAGYVLRDGGSSGCSAVAARAETAYAPVDVVWILDNSGSMSEDAALVQNNLNSFASTIEGAGIDVHVVLITAAGFAEVPAPLGTDPNRFLRVNADVQSHNSFQRLLDTYSEWGSFLRPASTLNFIVTTDDSSDMDADDFRSQMLSTIRRDYRFHAIASPPGSGGGTFPGFGCSGDYGDAQGNGDEYWDVAHATGGTTHSICENDWSTLFADLSRAIAVQLAIPCTYQIPEPPSGEVFDPNKVNVEYTNGSTGAVQTIPYTGSGGACSSGGWYFDADDPAEANNVVLCPSTCATVEADTAGAVDVAFGCATILI